MEHGATKVVVFKWNGTSLAKITDYAVAAGEAIGGFSGHVIADSIVITGTNTAPRYMNITNGKYYVLDVIDPANATLVKELGPFRNNTNGNNTGGIIFDEATGSLYIVETNNALMALELSNLFTSNEQIVDEPANLGSMTTIQIHSTLH